MADSGTYDQATIARRQKIAEQMLANAQPPANMRSPWQGLSYLANTGADAFALNRLDKQAKESRDADRAALMSVLGGDSATPAAPSSLPSPSAPPPISSDQPRGIRNNNPLNIEAGDFTKGQPGFLGSDGRFARFETPQQGTDAAGKLLDIYSNKHGLNTVNGIVNRWAPASDNNPSQAYASSVAGRMGVGADDALNMADPAVKQKIIAAMGQFENGRPVGSQGSPPAPSNMVAGPGAPSTGMPPAAPPAPAAPPSGQGAVAAAMNPQGPNIAPLAGANAPQGIPDQQKRAIAALLSATPGSPAQQLGLQLVGQSFKPHDYGFQTLPDGTILRTNPHTGTVEPIYQAPSKPQFVPNVSPNAYGVAQPGFVDPLNKKAFDIQGNPLTAAPGATGQQSTNPDVTGDDFLKTLPKAQADQIKGITEGRISPPGSFALKTPYWQKMLTDVAQYEPGFDLTKWSARNATAKDFASGKSAQNITSFNTAIGHLDTLDKQIDKLGNTDFPSFNSVANWVKTQAGNTEFQKAKTAFETSRQAVTDELTRAFRGSGGNVHDIKGWEEKINSASSPAALHEATKSAIELLRSRIESVGDQYNRGMNTKTEPVKLLSPKAQEAVGRLSGESAPEPKTSEAAPKVGEEKEFKQGVGIWDGAKWVPKGGPPNA